MISKLPKIRKQKTCNDLVTWLSHLTWSSDMAHNLIRVILQSHKFSSPQKCYHPQASPKTSYQLALHFYLGPNSLSKKGLILHLHDSVTLYYVKGVTLYHTEDGTLSYSKNGTLYYTKVGTSYYILDVILYYKVWVDDGLAISTGRCWLRKRYW